MKYSIVGISCLLIIFLSGCGGGADNPAIDVPIIQPPPVEVADEVEIFGIDIETAIYSGNILHNNAEYHSDSSNQEFLLKGMGIKDELTTLTSLEQLGFERQLILGSYQVEYSEQNGTDMPLNNSMVIRHNLGLTENLVEDISIESYLVSFNVQLNENPFPSSPTTEVIFFLKPITGDDEILLGSSFLPGQPVRVLAGDYQVVYKYIRGENIPINVDFTLPDIYSIIEDTTLEIGIDAVDVRVRFNSENNETQFDSNNIAHFFLNSSGTESLIDLGSTEQQIISVPLIVGGYDLIYDYRLGEQIPINIKQKIAEVSVADGTVIQPTVNAVSLEGDFLHNGATPSDSGLDNAWLFLQEQDSQERYLIGSTNDLSYENLNILAGSYDVIYEYREGNTLPTNSYTPMIQSVPLLESGRYDIDINSILVDFSITLNGETFPESGLSYANIYLDGKGDEQVFLGESNSDLQQVRILSGDYSLHYFAREFESVPINQHFKVDTTIALSESGQYSYNFEAKVIRVEALINGREDLSGPLAYGNLYLEREGNSRVALGTTYIAEDVMVMSGSYDIYYQFWEGGDVMPQNKYSKVQGIVVP